MNDIANATTGLDLETASLDQLENVSLGDILGGDVTQFDISDGLPDATVGVMIDDYEIRRMEAKPEEGKKARVDLNIKFKVTHVFECSDADVDPQSLVGRYHFEAIPLLMDFGPKRLVKLILGAVGVSFKDKEAWKQLDGPFDQVLEQLKSGQVQFGIQIKTTERNGYSNTRFVDKQKAFISMQQFQEMAA